MRKKVLGRRQMLCTALVSAMVTHISFSFNFTGILKGTNFCFRLVKHNERQGAANCKKTLHLSILFVSFFIVNLKK
jgi:hypothetical protein